MGLLINIKVVLLLKSLNNRKIWVILAHIHVLRINFIQMLLHKQYITFLKW